MRSGQSAGRPWPQVETLRAAFPAQAARRAVSGAMDVTRHCTDYRGGEESLLLFSFFCLRVSGNGGRDIFTAVWLVARKAMSVVSG
jgi:hypothetical protein